MAVGGANAGGANAGGTNAQTSDHGAHHRTAEGAQATTPAPTSGSAAATPVDAPARDAAAPVPPAGPNPASAMHSVATPDAGLQVSAPAAPAPAQAATPAPPSQPTFPVPLSSQLSGQLTSLRQMPQGEHVLTLTVNPETFGPVKVVAHITHDGVSLQLFGASDQARAALKAALPDLRRDLAGTGLQPEP